MLHIISINEFFVESIRPCSCAAHAVALAYCVQTGDAPLISLMLLHCFVPGKQTKETTECGNDLYHTIQGKLKTY